MLTEDEQESLVAANSLFDLLVNFLTARDVMWGEPTPLSIVL